MKTFLASLLLSVASAAPTPDVSSHVNFHGHGAVVSHGSHLTHGLVAATPVTHAVQAVPTPVQAVRTVAATPLTHAVHAVHTPVQAVRTLSTPVVAATPVTHAVHAVHTPVHSVRTVANPVVAAPVQAVRTVATPVVAATPVTHSVHAVHTPVQAVRTVATPVVAAPVAYHAPATVTYEKEVPEPYTYSYGVADDYSKSNFQASESGDANGVVGGSYSVNLPDGRIQTVTYNADHANGYVAEVAYSGEAVYPPAPAGGYPGEGHAVVAAPAYHA